jgi:hypothetical protein
MELSKIQEFKPDFIKQRGNPLYICAGSFEDRALGIVKSLDTGGEKSLKYSIILKYGSAKKDNKKNLKFLKRSLKRLSFNLLDNVEIDIDDMLKTGNNLSNTLREIPSEEIDSIFIDISGMTNFLILLALHRVNETFYGKEIFVLYAEAQDYYPKKEEMDEILELVERRQDGDIMELSKKLGTSGARETLIPPDFKGYFKEDYPICLIFFAGYEPSRAIGLIETYRPNLIITCYGISPHEHFKQRTEFSKNLHTKFEVFKQYSHVDTEVSTFNIQEIVSKLEEIYASADNEGKILYEKYNIAISPQCSKLQTLATYLFSLRHPDIQVVFCLPGSYNPERYSKGTGKMWMYKLPAPGIYI